MTFMPVPGDDLDPTRSFFPTLTLQNRNLVIFALQSIFFCFSSFHIEILVVFYTFLCGLKVWFSSGSWCEVDFFVKEYVITCSYLFIFS